MARRSRLNGMPSFSPSKKYWRISGRIASKMKRRWAAIG